MGKQKDPAFLFYSGDFLVGTRKMTYDQKGKYIELLCVQHDNGGHLTQDDIDFILPDHDQKVLKKFVKDGDYYYNIRLKEEMDKRKAYSESRSRNRKGSKEHMSNICQSYDEHMENTNRDVNKDIDIDVIKKEKDTKIEMVDPFDMFWKAYPKKVGKEKCRSWFKSRKVSQEFFDKIMQGLAAQKKHNSWKKENGKFIPHPMTWLNRGGWDDELDADTETRRRWEIVKGLDGEF